MRNIKFSLTLDKLRLEPVLTNEQCSWTILFCTEGRCECKVQIFSSRIRICLTKTKFVFTCCSTFRLRPEIFNRVQDYTHSLMRANPLAFEFFRIEKRSDSGEYCYIILIYFPWILNNWLWRGHIRIVTVCMISKHYCIL